MVRNPSDIENYYVPWARPGKQFGVGLDAASSWTTQWAADHTSVRIAYSKPQRGNVTIIVFRAVDDAGNTIGAPARFAVPGRQRTLRPSATGQFPGRRPRPSPAGSWRSSRWG